MIRPAEIHKIVKEYSSFRIGVLGSHSALEIMDGAKDEGLQTVVICQKGRDAPYRRFQRIADEIIVVDKFQDMASAKMQKLFNDTNTIIIPHRALTAYLGYDVIENKFKVPIFGNRSLFQAEERSFSKNQYHLLEKSKVRFPRLFRDPKKIDRPAIVKVQEKTRKMERAFFTVSSYEDYKQKSEERIRKGIIRREDLKKASIEELVLGTYMNFNYFHTPISEQVDFIGIERRLQTNLYDFNSLPAKQQMDIDVDIQNIEVGHTPASIRESLLEKVIEIGDKFVAGVRRIYPPGIIGPFSLQSVITKDLELVVYDVSLRVPGNPIVATTSPYTKYQYGETFGVGRRIAMELKRAYELGRLDKVLT
ncbi:formate--phosphoribosylaminoimidazolecarboxamide ligase family protein [Candidatus Nitrosotenuis uzonensis]|uniref:5-formaminoimidazole-4-carboxamide-1-(Beta)-D-ribofuranosyl 5'-monophosphate synthetase n=1 Tax=Candidatus Nitrosotenuis uzonensis TaxID=1407055 RepID=V6ASG9_9ARCH|nr:formate--phosphoribosylaminoimidazolecarboxamide ligase family protein [Candidatus Nitrosotenuis uzonensis]CDI05534.1 5-formaminoimidazole-4-carboxamide-1-(beta)-D-ribofuranosyl 5'-monophosphate synthetase [Candidatus Nitrosotenuis uzonensis]